MKPVDPFRGNHYKQIVIQSAWELEWEANNQAKLKQHTKLESGSGQTWLTTIVTRLVPIIDQRGDDDSPFEQR